MVPAMRRKFNQEFTTEKYEQFLNELSTFNNSQLDFRIAETPVFIPKSFAQQALDACESIIDIITKPDFLQQTDKAIPPQLRVHNEDAFPFFIAFDFGICTNEKGVLTPQLIEMQGFPSLFGFQVLLSEISSKYFHYPENYSPYLNGLNRETYLAMLRKIIIADENPEQVILLEIFPEKQKTRIDFKCIEDYLGIKAVCLTALIQEGRSLFYFNNGVKTKINRIFNRLIFDDLLQQPKEVQEKGKILQQDLDVTWVPHPNWFYRISKFTLPFINHPNVPQTWFLADVKVLPDDLENYVVKPLFSFAGQGVIIDVSKEDIDKITDKENWILQRKVTYAAVIETPDEPAKAEFRFFYFWDGDAQRPIATNNLARLSKGKMIGVNYNKDKSWVGGSFCLFEQG